jgi:hypothetical protein
VHAIVGSARGDAGLDSVTEATTLPELEAAGARLARG